MRRVSIRSFARPGGRATSTTTFPLCWGRSRSVRHSLARKICCGRSIEPRGRLAMTTFPNSPRVLKGGIVLIDPVSARVLRIISLQYNPETLSRSLQVQTTTGENGDRSEPMRFKGPPVETIKLEADIDAAD